MLYCSDRLHARRLASKRPSVGAILTVALSATIGCGPQPVILDTEGLNAAATHEALYYAPAWRSSEASAPPAGPPLGGFWLDVRAPSDELTLGLHNSTQHDHPILRRVAPPEPLPGAASELFASMARIHAPALHDDVGIYWAVPAPDADGRLPEPLRLGGLIRTDRLTPQTQLWIANGATPTGLHWLGASIPLVPGFYHLATVGESITWGNGLPTEDKFPVRVARRIEQVTGLKVIHQFMALSSAPIVPPDNDGICTEPCFRDAPATPTSITLQVDLIEQPDRIDAIIVQGCLNDVGLWTILNTQTTPADLVPLTEWACGDAMYELLDHVQQRLPNAAIVVPGYYPLFSEESGSEDPPLWLDANRLNAGADFAEAVDLLADNCRTFVDVGHEHTQQAIEALNTASTEPPRIAFADPRFSPENATFAPAPWVWGVTKELPYVGDPGLGVAIWPEDPYFVARMWRCIDEADDDLMIGCIFSSLGHPNERGSQAYADAIMTALRDLDALP